VGPAPITSPNSNPFGDLSPRRGPTRGLLARVLPDPLHEEGRARYLHQDLEQLTPVEAAWELHRLRVAVALAPDVDQVPAWVVTRLRRLSARRRRSR
jgi:hypothetical protein